MGWADTTIADDLQGGFPIVGDLPLSRLWPEGITRTIQHPVESLTYGARASKLALLAQLRRHGIRPDTLEIAQDIYRQTVEEQNKHRIGPSCNIEEHATIENILATRFGVQQLSSKGKQKIRCIDDFLRSGVNAATGVHEKLHHQHV
jgi:hypothetical protein